MPAVAQALAALLIGGVCRRRRPRLGAAGQLPLEPVKETGQSVTGAFEGWYQNPDGTYTLLVGYFNRNQKADARHPDRPEQSHRARRTRSRPADALPAAPAVGRLHDHRAEGLRQEAS